MRRTVGRLFLLLAILLIGLAGLLVGRTTLLPDPQPPPLPAPSLPVDADAAARRLGQALQIQTVSYPDPEKVEPATFLAFHRYLAHAFPDVHRALRREVIHDYSLLYTWPGTDPTLPPIVLMAHLDVVPVEPGTEGRWSHPPFSGNIADGFVWGRGTMDMKGTVLGTLEAVSLLLRDGFQPRRTVLLAFGHDEEIGGQAGAKAIAAALRDRGLHPALILDEGLAIVDGMLPGLSVPMAFVGVAEKGYLSLELVAESPGGHSSMPPPQTAVGILSSAIHALEAHPFPAHLDGLTGRLLDSLAPELPFLDRLVLANLWLFSPLVIHQLDATPATRALLRTTVAATMFEGSVKDNVLPARARAVINLRIHPADRIQAVLAHVRRTINDPRVLIRPLDGSMSEPSPESPLQTPGYAWLRRTIGESFPDARLAPGLVLGATDSRHYRDLSPAIYRFLPIRLTVPDTVRIHGTDERLAVADYADAIAFYARLIRNASEPGQGPSPTPPPSP